MGALQDTYILGVGDNLNVSLIGQQNNVLNATVNRDGNVQLPKLPPIAAAGRRLGDVRTEIEARVRTAYLATQVYVSVGAVRQVSVLVSGEVLAPGAVSVSALNSPIDAILLAGGVKKTGSLRQVKIIRGDKTIPIDLYAALTSSSTKLNTSVADGDRIIVPPINETAAIAGDVPRPGIFEMAPSASSISVESLLTLGGRFSRGGTPRLSILRVASDGTQVLEPVKGLSGVLHRGDILFVAPQSAPEHGRVALSGQVRNPGTFDLSRAPTLRTLLGSPNVYEEQPYMVFAAISRRDPQTLARVIVPFAPAQVLQGTFDLPLQDDDIVRVFSVAEVRVLAAQLRAEDDARNPAIRDLRTSQSGAGAGQSRGGTVGAALAGQNNQGLSGGGTASAGAGATPQSGTSVSGLAGVPAQTNVLPQQPSGAYVPNQPSGVGALAYGANQPYGGAYPQGQAQQQGQNVQPMGTYSSQAYPFGYQYQAPGYQGYPPPAYYQGYPQYPAFQQPGYPYPPFQGAPYMRGGGPADAVQGLPMYKAQRPAYDPKLQPFSRNNLVFDLSDPSIRSQLANYRVSLLGAVHVTGDYLAAPGVGLDSLVEAAGGLTITADLTSIEVTSTIYDQQSGQANTTRTSFSAAPSQLGKIALHSRDVIRFRDVYSDRDAGQVVLRGQVRFPGSFDILRGERLSSLLARAGGLTDISYPAGAVFTRESAARAEEDGYRRAAEELEREFTVLVSSSDQATSVSPQGVQFIRETIERLQTAQGVGRISVDADPVSIAAHPSRDMVLEPGDFLFVPRRPNSVS
ncbi:MAG TPA: SLBB domain-containing protein, partial [Alphaproteobacteria bacterium]|nr:SLBB domain-containing protein [Alphaproteobacteria bacterium]